MKKASFLFSAFIFISSANAQLKTTPVCPPFVVDLLEGSVNETVHAYSTLGQVQKKFPCFSGAAEADSGSSCAGVFFKAEDIRFFTGRNYIEIGERFKGRLEPALMGAGRSGLFKLLGNPVVKDIGWDAFQTRYGTLVLYYSSKGKVNKIQFSNQNTSSLKLCEQ